MNELINTCYETTKDYHQIALYSHLVPVSISILVAGYVALKTKFSLVARVFASFIAFFCLWLIGDVYLWTSQNYKFVAYIWSLLDLINVVFFVLGLHFFRILVLKRDGSLWEKFFYILLIAPAVWFTMSGISITGFNQVDCEAYENTFLTYYKFFVEGFVIVGVVHAIVQAVRRFKNKISQSLVPGIAIILFFLIFSTTEFWSTVFDVYEINLYSLFILPITLGVLIYSITNLSIFQIRMASTRLIAYVLVVLVATQLIFLEGLTDILLSSVTLIVTMAFAFILVRNLQKQVRQQELLEKITLELKSANVRLVELDKQKSEFVSFATHQLRSPITALKGYASLILDGEYGKLPESAQEPVQRIYDSSITLNAVVDDYLNISRIELGTMKYDFAPVSFKDIVDSTVAELKPNIDKAEIKWTYETCDSPCMINADKERIKQVVSNLIDNSLKYSNKSFVHVSIAKQDSSGTVKFTVQDGGIGISSDVLTKLFEKFVRANNASKTNIRGTGLGLYVAREIIRVHKGTIKAESEGEGKGSKFSFELPVI